MSTGLAQALEDLRRSTAVDLKDLRRNWGTAYEITGAPVWRAVRRDDRLTLIAASPGRLRDLITADYTGRPVPRPRPEIRNGGPEIRQQLTDLGLLRVRPAALKPPAPEPHPLMPPGEVAGTFGVGSRTVARWDDAGDLDSVRLPSGVRRYFRAQVEALARGEPLTPEQVRALREELADLRPGPALPALRLTGRRRRTGRPRR